MARATAAETADRVDTLRMKLLAGDPPTAVSPLRDSSGGAPGLRATDC